MFFAALSSFFNGADKKNVDTTTASSGKGIEWPFEKLKANLAKLEEDIARKYSVDDPTAANCDTIASPSHDTHIAAIFVSTGAMNPIHLGHVTMLEKAATMINRRYNNGSTSAASTPTSMPMTCVGAFISPSHDMYLEEKFGYAAENRENFAAEAKNKMSDSITNTFIPSEHRVAMAELAVKNHPLVAVGRWESAKRHRYWPDFPEVAAELQLAVIAEFGGLVRNVNISSSSLSPSSSPDQSKFMSSSPGEGNKTLKIILRVYFVCGEDLYSKCGLQRGLNNKRHHSQQEESALGVIAVTRNGKNGAAPQDPHVILCDVSPSSPSAAEAKATAIETAASEDDITGTFSSTKVREVLKRFVAAMDEHYSTGTAVPRDPRGNVGGDDGDIEAAIRLQFQRELTPVVGEAVARYLVNTHECLVSDA